MTTDYALSLLCYLVQYPEGSIYIETLDEDIFELIEDKLTLQVLKKYYNLYKALPSQTVALEFLEEQIEGTPDLTNDIVESLRVNFADIYVPLPEGDIQKIQDTIILEIQKKKLGDTFLDFAAKKIGVDQVFARIDRLNSLVKSAEAVDYEEGGFLIQDRYKHFDESIEGFPTFLYDLNGLTAAGGFYSPQLIIFLSGPKYFKTGIILKIGIEYAREGKKVYYADNENGAKSIRNRAKMCIMECELHELYEPGMQEKIDNTLYRFGHYMKGDLFIDSYSANSKSISDVRARLRQLKDLHNWEPNIIIYDTIDKFIPTNTKDQGRDTRIKIQLVYDEVINLNKEIGTFAIAPSQVNRKAIGKKTFDIRDLSEDFGKSFNAHAIFAICATPKEEEENIRRIIPVCQREGVKYKGTNVCIVKVDEKTMNVEEINEKDKEEYLKNLSDD